MNTPQRRFRELTFVLAAGLLAAFVSCGTSAETITPEAGTAAKSGFQIVSFDEAMRGQIIRSMPLKLAFPADYAMHVLEPAIYGVVWAHRGDLDHIARTGGVPPGAGVFHGRLTVRVGYDSGSNSFICGPGCDETKLKQDIEAAGADNVKVQRRVVNGIPLLLIEMGSANIRGSIRKKLYMAYIAVLIDTNVMLVSYSPPSDSKDDGEAVWKAFVRSLMEST